MQGKVYLVGCGPGAADLLTLRAVEALKKADVVMYDRLVDKKVLEHAKRARKIPSGKRPGEPLKQEWINRKLYSEVRKGKIVARLKNGDPMVFGRGGEELEFLQQRGVEVEVVPGLSSAISLPSLAGIPLTKRGVSSGLTILTGHRADGKGQSWKFLGDTVVVLMAMENLDAIVWKLVHAGKGETTPCALISNGATDEEQLAVSTLGKISDFSTRLGLEPPAVLVVGDVVDSLLDFKGKRVTTFRAHDEVTRTEKIIRRAGGLPEVFEICEIEPARENLNRASEGKWDTLVFMSTSGVRAALKFFDFKKYTLIAVGGATRKELRKHARKRIWVPKVQNLDGIRKMMKVKNWGKVLAFRSPLAEEKLVGATNVVAYKVKPKNLSYAVRRYLKIKSDFTILTSTGLLEFLLKASDNMGLRKKFVEKVNNAFVISLGKSVTERALAAGIKVNYEPENPTIDSLFRRK